MQLNTNSHNKTKAITDHLLLIKTAFYFQKILASATITRCTLSGLEQLIMLPSTKQLLGKFDRNPNAPVTRNSMVELTGTLPASIVHDFCIL